MNMIKGNLKKSKHKTILVVIVGDGFSNIQYHHFDFIYVSHKIK